MPRIRTVKPEFWTDEKITELSIPARLFFIGMWNFADDNGVLENKPKQLKIRIFPTDKQQVEPLLEELINLNIINTYSINGNNYLWIRNFSRHQKIDRTRKSNFPDPPDNLKKQPLPEINGNQKKSVEISPGREGKGKGRERKTPLPPLFSISDSVRNWAQEKGYDHLEEHLEIFISKVKAKGYTYIDWDEAFMNCIREDWGKIRADRTKEDQQWKNMRSGNF